MGVKLFATLLFNVFHVAYADHILSCNLTQIEPCPGHNQICQAISKSCVCEEGFTMVEDECVIASLDLSYYSRTTAIVTIFTLALLACGLILVVRKYNLIEYARQRINWRRNNDVMYEDVMIGQDDPPLSP